MVKTRLKVPEKMFSGEFKPTKFHDKVSDKLEVISFSDVRDDAIISEYITQYKEKLSSYGVYLSNVLDFMKSQGYSQEQIAAFQRTYSDVLPDGELGGDYLKNGEVILFAKADPDHTPSRIESDVVGYGVPEGFKETVVDGKGANAADLYYAVRPVYEGTTRVVGPGWDDNVWKLYFKDYTGQEVFLDDKFKFKENPISYGRSGANFDEFWIMYDPGKFRGIAVCLPSLYETFSFNYSYGSKMFYVYGALFFLVIYFIYTKLFRKTVESIPIVGNVLRAARGRPPKTKND